MPNSYIVGSMSFSTFFSIYKFSLIIIDIIPNEASLGNIGLDSADAWKQAAPGGCRLPEHLNCWEFGLSMCMHCRLLGF